MIATRAVKKVSRIDAAVRPLRHLREMPDGMFDAPDAALRAAWEHGRPNWPPCCLMPVSEFLRSKDVNLFSQFTFEQVQELHASTILFGWRYTQSVFSFHPDLQDELMSGGDTETVPSEALLYMPVWCPYILTPGFDVGMGPIHGVFPMLNWVDHTQKHELRIGVDFHDGLRLIAFPLDGQTVREATAAIIANMVAGKWPEVARRETENAIVEVASKVIPLILYLCMESPEIVDRATNGGSWSARRPPLGAHGPVLPDYPRTWNVGTLTGRAIRAARKEAGAAKPGSKSPHLRSAHWHHFWTGPRDGYRKIIVKFLPPTFVGGVDGGGDG